METVKAESVKDWENENVSSVYQTSSPHRFGEIFSPRKTHNGDSPYKKKRRVHNLYS